MPITKIDTKPKQWTPVKIEMEFTTRDELGVFIAMVGNPYAIAEAIKYSGRIDHLTCPQIQSIIDGMVPRRTFDQLIESWE